MIGSTTKDAGTKVPDRETIRVELEVTRRAYNELVMSIPEDEWKTKSANPEWRVGQLLWHLAWGAGYFPRGVHECRKGTARTPPAWITNPLNLLITKIGSRGATRQRVTEKYNSAHAAILTCLDGVQDNEWNMGVKPLGAFGQYKTVESVFHSVTLHFKEHEADVLKGLRSS
jgi:hypothetical protein